MPHERLADSFTAIVAATVLTLTFLPALYAMAFGAARSAGADRPSIDDAESATTSKPAALLAAPAAGPWPAQRVETSA